MENKQVNRESTQSTKIFDDRTLANDYRTLRDLLRPGLRVLDIGCGTGSITKDIAEAIGSEGRVTGIDNTQKFIESGQKSYGTLRNLELLHADLFSFEPGELFDLIVSARTMQWLTNVEGALLKIKSMLKPGGCVSILDYNHEKVSWKPQPPESMLKFYAAFLLWRKTPGMHNDIAEKLPTMLETAGFSNVSSLNSDEHYRRGEPNFEFRAGIWSKVAGLTQIVTEGYSTEEERLKAIEEYDQWVQNDCMEMTLKLSEVRGINS